ncbi:hypothetical protein PVAP13_2NG275003 [Panicum virgatum]|uniref:Uncharacterized protein n=1 Tax=Panicum virgatum TaxID=38727 RepID=A0A8T0V8V5_PANVG|nr:hypothetical protein PVAP13_2NG275003 [Panicum virgatum]
MFFLVTSSSYDVFSTNNPRQTVSLKSDECREFVIRSKLTCSLVPSVHSYRCHVAFMHPGTRNVSSTLTQNTPKSTPFESNKMDPVGFDLNVARHKDSTHETESGHRVTMHHQ